MAKETLTEKADRYRKHYSFLSAELDKPENLDLDSTELMNLRKDAIKFEHEAAKQENRAVRDWAKE